MRPWVLLDTAQVPGNDGELQLYQRDEDFSIKIVGRGELMNSRVHNSEDVLAQHTCEKIKDRAKPRMLIGGLGMGFTLAASLKHIGEQGEVVVAELVPAVVKWNQGPLGEHAGYPINDARVTVRLGDVSKILKAEQNAYDAILLDVDNGPEGLTRKKNNWLYSEDGLIESYTALRPKGVLAVWSAGPAPEFLQRLKKVGFKVKEKRVHAHTGSKGAKHVIWFAQKHG